jgi:hypothetical protein
MKTNNYAWVVRLTGWLALVIFASQFVIFQIGLLHGHPFDPVIGLEMSLMAVLAVMAFALAECLKRIEARLTKIESEQPVKPSGKI